MKVYVVEYTDWDGSTIRGIFSTLEKAQQLCDDLNKDNDWHDVTEFEVDECIDF